MNGKKKNRWTIIKGQELTEMDRIILDAQERGKLVPSRSLIKTPEQIEANDWEVLEDGDIINVDCTTILDGYYADASRMYVVGGKTDAKRQKLVDVAWECLKIGEEVCSKPYVYVGDIGNAIQKHARKNGFSVVRDLSGHGVGLEFHEEPDVDHYGHKGTGMLLVPGMVFTIEPMINMGTWEVFCDEDDGWTVVTEDELPSAQWEHTFVMTEHGVEVLTH